MKRPLPLILAGGCLLVGGQAHAEYEYPDTPQQPLELVYGNVVLKDAFVWLESVGEPAVESWFREQDAFARNLIASFPERDALFERIKAIDESKTVQIYNFNRVGERYFYFKQEVGDDVGRLFYRDGTEGEDRLLVDAARFGGTDGIYSIQSYAPSRDGSLVAVMISAGGSEIPTLHVVETETGVEVGASIPRVRGRPSWLEDNSGFYYIQLRPETPGEDRSERFKRVPTKFHRLGSDPADDPVLVSYDQHPSPGLREVDTPYVFSIPGSPYTGLLVNHGVEEANTFFATTELDPEDPGATDWMPICSLDDEVESLALHEDSLFLLSFKNAPRRQILRADVRDFSMDAAEVVLPESDRVITGMAVLGGRLYVTAMEGGIDQLLVADPSGEEITFREIGLPLIGRVTLLANDDREEDIYFSLTSWKRAPAYYRYDPATGEVTLSELRPLGPYDAPDNLIVERVLVPSHDGVEIPLTLIRTDGVEPDGSNPVILYGYGAYGNPLRPGFGPMRLAWYEQGGMFAIAHVRGGGEFGKEWHEGGHLETKRNSWLDFHACAEYLIDAGWTSAKHIGAMGGSMGGVLVGRAMTSRPELYGAVVSRVGNQNPVRNHKRANGPANYPEYGNPLDPNEFPYVLAMDSYYAIQEGVDYPPMLLTSGFNDTRVPSWMPGKMAARLQYANPEGGPYLKRVEFNAGHGGVARSDIWEEQADVYAFFLRFLAP